MDFLLKVFLTSVVVFILCLVICRSYIGIESKAIDAIASVGVVSFISALINGALWSVGWIWR